MNQFNQELSREMSVEELALVSGGNAASDEVVEQQIETVVVSGSYSGISSGTISSLGASTVGSLGGGYGSFLQGYLPGAIGTAAVAATNEAGEDLEKIGNGTMAIGTIVSMGHSKLGKYIGGVGGIMWGSGKLLQTIDH